MKKKLWPAFLLVLCLAGALAEEAVVDELPAEDAASAAVEAEVGEVSLSLEGDPESTVVEDVPEGDGDYVDPGVYILDCPDVYADVVREQAAPSDRVYPEPLVWPLEGLPPLQHVTSHVGWRDAARIHRRQGGAWASWLHHGVDVGGAEAGHPVVAAADGIAYAGFRKGIGNYVVVDHQNGWYTRYQHLSAFSATLAEALYGEADSDAVGADAGQAGVAVKAGERVGFVGSSGGSYSPHLHFEIAWSPDGPGADGDEYQRQTMNKKIDAYSFPQQARLTLHWARTWEICSAELQNYITPQAESGQ